MPNWEVVSKSPEVVSSDWIVQLYYNSNILRVETVIRVETAIRVETPLLVSCAAPVQCFQNCFKLFQVVSNCFKLFQVVQIVITLGQQPACRPMIICLINKVCDQFNT